jgi:hypothetical protein
MFHTLERKHTASLDQQLADGVGRLDRLPEKHLQAPDGVFAERDEQRHADQDGDQQGQQRRGVAPEGGRLGADFELHAEASIVVCVVSI